VSNGDEWSFSRNNLGQLRRAIPSRGGEGSTLLCPGVS